MPAASIIGYVFSLCLLCEAGAGYFTGGAGAPEGPVPRAVSFRSHDDPAFSGPDVSGKWYAILHCGVGSGRYIYYLEQTPDGRLSGSSRGVSFGVKDITGLLVTGRFSATRFEFFEQISEGYFIEVSGSTRPEKGYLSASYRNTRTDRDCSLRMKKMRDQRPVAY